MLIVVGESQADRSGGESQATLLAGPTTAYVAETDAETLNAREGACKTSLRRGGVRSTAKAQDPDEETGQPCTGTRRLSPGTATRLPNEKREGGHHAGS